MTSHIWLCGSTNIWFIHFIATDMIKFVCHSWSKNQTFSEGTLILNWYKHFLACGRLSLIVLLPWYLIRPISIYWNSYFAWGSKPNEMHQFFYFWTVEWCFLLCSPKSRWTGWILMLWNYYKLSKTLLLTGKLISHNVTVVMDTGDVKLQGNVAMLVNQANSVGFEPFRRLFFPRLIYIAEISWLFLLWRFSLRKENHLACSLLANHPE